MIIKKRLTKVIHRNAGTNREKVHMDPNCHSIVIDASARAAIVTVSFVMRIDYLFDDHVLLITISRVVFYERNTLYS